MDLSTLPFYVDLGAVADGGDASAVLETLDRLEVRRVQAGPGRRLGDGWRTACDRWSERLVLHHACLALPEEPRWNLAAGDDELRRQAVTGVTEALTLSAEIGAPFYSVHAGWLLHLTHGPDDEPTGRDISPLRAADQLCRSLDRLAAVADRLRIDLLVETAPLIPAHRPAFADPEGMVAVFDRLQAAPLGMLADLASLVVTARHVGESPEAVLAFLGDRVRAVELSHAGPEGDRHLALGEADVELALARLAGGFTKPVILQVRGLEPAAIRDQVGLVCHVLGPPPPPPNNETFASRLSPR